MPSDRSHVPFSKYSGAGNDFAIVVAHDLSGIGPRELARAICPRSTGVGVDGLIIVEPAGAGLAARFFNPDGSEFSTCGNGTRCAARFGIRRGLVSGGSLLIHTAGGTVHARVDGEIVSLDFQMEIRIDKTVDVPYEDARRQGWLVQVGTPHLVLPVERVPEGELADLARPIRYDPALGPDGANVDFVSVTAPGEVTVRTYERGVEGETLACGSGAMAAAVSLAAAGACGPSLTLHTRGGALLKVELLDVEEAVSRLGSRRVRLTGPAVRVFDGEYPIRSV